MGNMIGKDFSSLEERVLYNYRAVVPSFMSSVEAGCDEKSQVQFFRILEKVYTTISEHPDLLGLTETPDGYLANNALNKSNPELIKRMKKIEHKIDQFFTNLMNIGLFGEIEGGFIGVSKDDLRLSTKTLRLLKACSLHSDVLKTRTIISAGEFSGAFPAWKYLAKHLSSIDDKRTKLLRFRTATYASGSPARVFTVFDRLFEGNENYKSVRLYMSERGYRPIVDFHRNIRVGYLKSIGKNQIYDWSDVTERNCWGTSLAYDSRFKDQVMFTLHLPKFMEILKRFGQLDDSAKKIIMDRTKGCNNCGYCTQTDKTGKRKPLAVTIEYNGETRRLCPLYPAWNYRSFSIDNDAELMAQTILNAVDPIYAEL